MHKAVYQGLGGSFDVYTGRVPRAPRWWIEHNMEFAYDVAVYYAACQPVRIENFFGIYGHEYAFPFVGKINKLVGVGERIHHHPAQIRL